MKVKQVSVFLENKVGHLADCIRFLSENDVSINAMSLSNTAEFDILHFIVENPDRVCKLLQRNGFGVGETGVMLLNLSDTTKPLEAILNTFKENNINVEYMYMGKDCQFIFRLDNIEAALKIVYTTEAS